MTEFVNDVFELFTLRTMDSGFRRNDGMNFKMSTEPTMTARPFDSPSPLVGEGWGEGYGLPWDSSLPYIFTLTPVSSTGQALTLSHSRERGFLGKSKGPAMTARKMEPEPAVFNSGR